MPAVSAGIGSRLQRRGEIGQRWREDDRNRQIRLRNNKAVSKSSKKNQQRDMNAQDRTTRGYGGLFQALRLSFAKHNSLGTLGCQVDGLELGELRDVSFYQTGSGATRRA